MNSKKNQTQDFSNHLARFERAISFGDGLFETIYFKDQLLYAWQYHYQRLKRGAQVLNLILPTKDELLVKISAELKKTKLNEAAIKLVVFRSSENSVGYQAGSNQADLVVFVRAYSRKNQTDKPAHLRVCQHRLSLNPYISEFKHTNRLDQVIARNELFQSGQDNQDGIMLSQNSEVIETTSANLLIYRNNQFYTPLLQSYGIRGVMREIMLDAMADLAIHIHHHSFELSFLKQSSEILLFNSLVGFRRAHSVENYFKLTPQKLVDSIETIQEKSNSIELSSAIKIELN